MSSTRFQSLSWNQHRLNTLLETRALASMAIGFMLAAGTWMSRPLGINAMDLLLIPAGCYTLFLFVRSRELPSWIIAIALSLLVGLLWPPVFLLTAVTSARAVALGVLCYWIWRRGALWPLSVGFLFGFVLQALPLPSVMFEARTPGLAPTISLLGMVGFAAYVSFSIQRVAVPWYFVVGGAVTIAASGARAPLLASLAMESIRGRRLKNFVLLIGLFVGAVYFQGGMHRITTADTVVQAVEVRMASANIQGQMSDGTFQDRYDYLSARADGSDVLIDDRSPRPIVDRIRGIGVSSYHAVIGWPRPHNIFTLAWREMGVFVLLPIIILISAVRQKIFGIGVLVVLALYGIMDDSLLSPNGHYVIASILLVEAMTRKQVGILVFGPGAGTVAIEKRSKYAA